MVWDSVAGFSERALTLGLQLTKSNLRGGQEMSPAAKPDSAALYTVSRRFRQPADSRVTLAGRQLPVVSA